MIQELKIKNFLSFKEEVRFSFEATNDTFAEGNQVVKVNDTVRLLRFAVVYGYNAAGKSNLLRAFDFLQTFWFNNPGDIDQPTGVVPFKLDAVSPHERSSFELLFYVDGTKYWYQLELDQKQVYAEKLSYYKSYQPTMLFDRRLEDTRSVLILNPTLKVPNAVKENITVNCLNNKSFFAARNQVNASIPLIDAAKELMRHKILKVITPSVNLTNFAQREVAGNSDVAAYIIDFLQEADFNITDIKSEMRSDTVDKLISANLRNTILNTDSAPADIKEIVRDNRNIRMLKTDFEHTVENDRGREHYRLSSDNDEESRGTIRTFGIEAAFFNALTDNAFLAIDEIETSLHPRLLEKIIYEYLLTESHSQILVTTHNDGLLDLVGDLIRKDSVWFAEKQKSGKTELFRLSDFRGVNRLSSIREAYRNKRFGATMN